MLKLDRDGIGQLGSRRCGVGARQKVEFAAGFAECP
jgi:hypothetical protein